MNSVLRLRQLLDREFRVYEYSCSSIANLLHAPFMPLFLTIGIGLLAGAGVAFVALGLLLLSLFAQFLAQRALMHIDKT